MTSAPQTRRLQALLLIGLVMQSGCRPLGPDGLFSDTVRLEQTLVTSLLQAQSNNVEIAEAAMASLEQEWKRFYAIHYEFGDMYWERCFDEAGRRIVDAREQLESGNAPAASEALSSAREYLMHARERIGMQYYPDALTRFEAAIAALEGYSAGRSDSLSYRRDIESAERYWGDVERFQWDPAVYGLDAGSVSSLNLASAEIDAALGLLKEQSTSPADSVSTAELYRLRLALELMLEQFGGPSAMVSASP